MSIRMRFALLGMLGLAVVCPLRAAVTEFGQVAVGATASLNVTVPLTAAQVAAGPRITLHYGIDFTSSACTPAASGCRLTVTFAPTVPGSRGDAVVVKDTAGNLLSKLFVHGTGMGPLGAFSPGVISLPYAETSTSPAVWDLAVDAKGVIYYVALQPGSQDLLKLTPGSSTPTTVASGIGGFALDIAGDIFYLTNNAIDEIDSDTGATLSIPLPPSAFFSPKQLRVDLNGNIFVLDNARVQRVDPATGAITLVAGNLSNVYSGDGGPAVEAGLYFPQAIALDAGGNLFIGEWDSRVREVYAATQIIETIAGNGTSGYSGDGGPAAAALLGTPAVLAVDAIGNVYFADSIYFVVREINTSTQLITTAAGLGAGLAVEPGFLANQVQLIEPQGLAVGPTGNLYFGSLYEGIIEVNASAPVLPFNWPGTFGAAPVLNEEILNIGNLPLTLNSAALSGPFNLATSGSGKLCALPAKVSVGGGCDLPLEYNRTAGTENGLLTLTDNALNAPHSQQQAILTVAFPKVVLSTTSYSFGNGVVGAFSGNLWLTIYNKGNAPLLIQSITFLGPDAGDFTYDATVCGPIMQAGSSCQLDIFFTPQGAGARSATLSLNTNGPDTPETVQLSGSAVPPANLVVSAAGVNFGAQAVGTISAPQTVTFTNTGGASLTFGQLPFVPSGGAFLGPSQTCLYGLEAGASCTVTALFAPLTSGAFSSLIYGQWSGAAAGGTISIPLSGTGAPAVFQKTDGKTQGTWTGVYGGDGALIANDLNNPPTYAIATVTGDKTYTWAASTSDRRALQTAPGSSSRIASTYYSGSSFDINVNLTDGNTHRIALYLLDWDSTARSETISILDAHSDAALDTESFSNFHAGQYVSWEISGDVIIRVTKTGGANAVVSGIFFDPLVKSLAVYGGSDSTTEGNWIGKYGAGGQLVADQATIPPAFAALTQTGDSQYRWAYTSDPRALQETGNSQRIAGTYYAGSNFSIGVNLVDGKTHKVSLYLLDWDSTSRQETIKIVDAVSKEVLATESFSGFHDGVWAYWNVTGNVLIEVTKTGGANAVVSGIFFD